jgi:signal transduction histidine kinase
MSGGRANDIRFVDGGGSMRLKTWLVAALGLGSLVALIAFSLVTSSRKAEDIYAQMDQLNAHHQRVDTHLTQLRSDVNLSGIFVRDYLLDVARERDPEYRESLTDFRRNNIATLNALETLIGSDDRIAGLRVRLDEYWEAFDPLFDWTITEKIIKSATFLRREVVPRREAVLAITYQVEQLNNANLAAQRAAVARQSAAFHDDLQRLFWQTVLVGLLVALVVVVRLRVLEHRSEKTERQMRELSQQLVSAQEEERRSLSRELHDHVAQVLTGLRMGLGRIERLSADPRVGAGISECKALVDDMFRTVRDLALGLRPSMLDDFGLQAALEWHVRDFTRRYAIDAELRMDGDFTALSDKQRTCVYRIVQEAMTNCIRHAQAKTIRVDVSAADGELRVLVVDDGVGLDPARPRSGLGLKGIDERVRELHGTMTISRQPGLGTTLAVQLPLPSAVEEITLARAAG